MTGVDEKLKQAITALKGGRKKEARDLLFEVLEQDESNEQAWLWMSGAVESDKQREICLEKVLEIDPDNEYALRGLERLRSSQREEERSGGKRPSRRQKAMIGCGVGVLALACIALLVTIWGISSDWTGPSRLVAPSARDLTVTPTSTTRPISEYWRTYVHNSGFGIRYPPGWTVTSVGKDRVTVASSNSVASIVVTHKNPFPLCWWRGDECLAEELSDLAEETEADTQDCIPIRHGAWQGALRSGAMAEVRTKEADGRWLYRAYVVAPERGSWITVFFFYKDVQSLPTYSREILDALVDSVRLEVEPDAESYPVPTEDDTGNSPWRSDLDIISKTYRRDGIGNFIVDGEIENTGTVTWCFVQISASGYDGSGELVDNGSTHADMRCIRPDDVSPFTIYIDEQGRGIKSYKVRVTGARRK